MSVQACESQCTVEKQPDSAVSLSASSVETAEPKLMEQLDIGDDVLETEISRLDQQGLDNPLEEFETEGEEGVCVSPGATVVPVNTPVTGDSGQGSPVMQSSSDSLSDSTQQHQDLCAPDVDITAESSPAAEPKVCMSDIPASTKEDDHTNQNGAKAKSEKESVKEAKKDEKKRSKKKEDKSVEYILRALNSLQSPEEKLAALCKKYADLHEEHRVLQTSFKTQQRSLTVVVREKDQLQSEHTKAMIAKSKLESLCRELQKHNKIIKEESIKRAKEDDEKRKEISAQFNVTIGEIQNQMTDNSEKNNRLRKENDNLAEQLRAFIAQCQGREEHVKKLQEHHDLEKKLAAAKLAQAEAILKEAEERSNKERELLIMKLTEVTKKSQLTENQLELYKSKYDEFNDLHTRSSETFQKYKVEMDKMTKRIKKLEKDGLQWKGKWESTSKALIEQYEARSKSEKEITVYAQKVKKLESLCRALQAELHRKKVEYTDPDKEQTEVKSDSPCKDDTPSPSAAPPNSPEAALTEQRSLDIAESSPSPESAIVPSDESPVSPLSSPSSITDSPPGQSEIGATKMPESSNPDDNSPARDSQHITVNPSPGVDSKSGVMPPSTEPVSSDPALNDNTAKRDPATCVSEGTL